MNKQMKADIIKSILPAVRVTPDNRYSDAYFIHLGHVAKDAFGKSKYMTADRRRVDPETGKYSRLFDALFPAWQTSKREVDYTTFGRMVHKTLRWYTENKGGK